MTNRTTVVLITVLTALAVGAGARWETARLAIGVVLVVSLASVPLSALLGYFEWRARFRRRILGAAEDDRRAA
jgi:hypothetical protein